MEIQKKILISNALKRCQEFQKKNCECVEDLFKAIFCRENVVFPSYSAPHVVTKTHCFLLCGTKNIFYLKSKWILYQHHGIVILVIISEQEKFSRIVKCKFFFLNNSQRKGRSKCANNKMCNAIKNRKCKCRIQITIFFQ